MPGASPSDDMMKSWTSSDIVGCMSATSESWSEDKVKFCIVFGGLVFRTRGTGQGASVVVCKNGHVL